MNQVELMMRRRNVAAFIKADPVSVAFRRATGSARTAAGGYVKNADDTLQPQQARIVQNRRRYTAGLVNSEAGDIPDTDYLLIAVHTTDIKVDDRFQWLGEWYKVDGIFGLREESVLAGIIFLGKENRDGTD